MLFKGAILIDLSQYLEMEVVDGVTKKVLFTQILKAYKKIYLCKLIFVLTGLRSFMY